MLLHVVSAAAPVAATAGHWVWEKSNSAVSRVSFFIFYLFNFIVKKDLEIKKTIAWCVTLSVKSCMIY
jgi:hypothetical protein